MTISVPATKIRDHFYKPNTPPKARENVISNVFRPLESRGVRYIDGKLSKANILAFLRLSATYQYQEIEILKLSKNYQYWKVYQLSAHK